MIPPSGKLKLGRLSAASALLAMASGGSYIFVDLSLNRMGATASTIGLNAAMPALGWLLATPLLPWALRRFDGRNLLLGLVTVAWLAILCFPAFPQQDVWLALRFLFGGCTGLVFRLVEYWINAASPENHRARNIGVYATAFASGAMIGAAVLPLVGVEGWPAIAMIASLVVAAGLLFITMGEGPPSVTQVPSFANWRLYRGDARLALFGVLVFGMFEAVLYTLMPVYALRHGLADHWAAWCAAAAIGGQIVMAAPVGIMADRWGKLRVTAGAAVIALALSCAIPLTTAAPPLLLVGMMAWGGFGGALYNLTLAMLADRFAGAELASANAAFGTLYAFGSLCGPLLHGLAMDGWNPHGVIVSSATMFAVFLCVSAGHVWRSRRGGWAVKTAS